MYIGVFDTCVVIRMMGHGLRKHNIHYHIRGLPKPHVQCHGKMICCSPITY